ncbi:MAG TPA: hypothetical protein VG268_21030 [Streptosporangiaceae bacterium]|nr:hypothetical protein [Streptosporangiaceae bacterium]
MTDHDYQADAALTAYAPDLDDPDEEAAGPAGPAGEVGADAMAAHSIALTAERDQLTRALRDTQRQLAATEEQLRAAKRSATMKLGQAIVQAAKRPWIGGPRLPVHLYRMWREGRGLRAGAGPGDGFRSEDEARWAKILLDAGAGAAGDRFLAAYTTPGLAWSAATQAGAEDRAGGLVVAGVLTDTSCAALAPDATVEQLLPHDASYVLEGSGADLMLIEGAALLGGAWAHAGDPAATDRGRRLADLIDVARALGKPVVFLRNAPSYLMPYLDWLGTYCDAVVDGGLGVQLARFNPIDLPGRRGTTAVYAAQRDPREAPATKRLLDELTGDGTGPVNIIGRSSWRDAPGVYRGHQLFLAATEEQAREQLACGARVVGPVTETSGRELTEAAGAGPRSMAEIKSVLLDLFETQATPVRLTELGRQVGLPRPVPGRRVAVLAGLRDAADAGVLADSVLVQRLRPAEVVVWLDGTAAGATGALDRIRAEGIAVSVVTGKDVAAAARAAAAPWSAVWEPGVTHGPATLAELMCALECSRADAVGYVPGADYVFVDVLDPAVARTELYRDGAAPRSAWGRRGLRLFAVAPSEKEHV